jgi:hypothetical protein
LERQLNSFLDGKPQELSPDRASIGGILPNGGGLEQVDNSSTPNPVSRNRLLGDCSNHSSDKDPKPNAQFKVSFIPADV